MPKFLKKKRYWLLIVVVGLIIYAVIRVRHAAHEISGLLAPSTATAAKLTLVQKVSASGRVVAKLDVDIKCKASGVVIKLPVQESDTVAAGDLLLELDPLEEQRHVRQAEIALNSSQAQLEQARAGLAIGQQGLTTATRRNSSALSAMQARQRDVKAHAERMRSLFEKKLASQEDADTARSAAAQADAELEAAEASVEDLKTQALSLQLKQHDVTLAEARVETDTLALSDSRQRLADTTLHAPMAGVITTCNVQTGQIIASGISNVSGGTTVLTISDLSKIFVIAAIDESDIGKIQPDQKAELKVDAFPQRTFSGTVTRVAVRGTNTANIVSFQARIAIDDSDALLLKPEMTVNVEISIAQAEDAIAIPIEAVTRKKDLAYVTLVKSDGSSEEREVKLGINDGEHQQIFSGIEIGAVVKIDASGAQSRWRKDAKNGKRGGKDQDG